MDNQDAKSEAKPKDRVQLFKEHALRVTEDLFACGLNETEALCVLKLAHAVGIRASPKADKTASAVVTLLLADAGIL